MAAAYADVLGAGLCLVAKKRKSATDVEAINVVGEVDGRDVLLVDDILDTGKTLTAVIARIQKLRPRQIKTCVLLDKRARRVANVQADYAGFDIPDLFVVGYGLDYAERYRNLPFVGVLHPRIYQED